MVLIVGLMMQLLPAKASAISSGEIRSQINALKEDRAEIQDKIVAVQNQYEENENEILDIVAKKNIVDQEIQLLNEQIMNINEQISAYFVLIADMQDDLDRTEERYEQLHQQNRLRVRTMEEEGELSFWEVLFKANSFSDLLDRLNMVEEIASADNRRLAELRRAAEEVSVVQTALEFEKQELEATKQDLDDVQTELDEKRAETDALLQELLEKADDLEALEAEFERQEQAFMEQIAQLEVEFDAARQREWEAFMATSVPATTAPSVNSDNAGSSEGTNSGNTGSNTSSGWLWPTSARRISSPFGYRNAPISGASTYHQGMDIDGNTGDPVWASRSGVVVASAWSDSAGNYVTIDHQDGYRSIYMHLSSRSVSAGTIVNAGQVIGLMGSTGISKGDHLHFGISNNGVYVNPANYVQ